MQYPNPSGPYLQPVKSDGTKPAVGAGGAVAFEAGAIYYVPLGGIESPLECVHVKWDASAVITSVEFEDTNMKSEDASTYDTTAGNWIKENPSSAYVAVVGAGATPTAMTVAVVGGAAGGMMLNVGNIGSRRSRLKVSMGATGGVLAFMGHGKS